jgi:hypothetical protein
MRSASVERFSERKSEVEDSTFYVDWVDSMTVEPVLDREEEPWQWTNPPPVDHYAFANREAFIASRLDRSIQRFSELGLDGFEKEHDRTLRLWEAHVEQFKDLQGSHHIIRTEERDPKPDSLADKVWLEAGGQLLSSKRVTATDAAAFRALSTGFLGEALGHRIDHWVHQGNDLAALLAVSDEIIRVYDHQRALPRISDDLSPAQTLSIDANGLVNEDRRPRKVGGQLSRSNYDIVSAIAQIYINTRFERIHNMSALGAAIQKKFHRKGVSDGWGRGVILRRGAEALEAVLSISADDAQRLDKLGPRLEQFATEEGL